MPLQKGEFYTTLITYRKDGDDLKNCMEKTVEKLKNVETSSKKPGILLGKVQSGKTRAFLGIIALAFDNGYDIAIILTKGTKPLTEQTLKRLHEDFGQFEEDNKIQIHDIMSFPRNMVPYELNQKLIIVAKKETNNLKHVVDILTEKYPDLQNKKILIVDDEADFASVSFYKEKESGKMEQRKIAQQIDDIRTKVKQADLLQVTATPYSLYLQPDDSHGDNLKFLPQRPSFTELVPIYKDYAGGDFYFIESKSSNLPASYVYEEVPAEELTILKVCKNNKRADGRSFKMEDITQKHFVIRDAVINFIVGGCIRRIQQKKYNQKQENYSFLIHTEQSRASHS
jgi:KaiC/GvpD/RAD55 family RecA-like ATPase